MNVHDLQFSGERIAEEREKGRMVVRRLCELAWDLAEHIDGLTMLLDEDRAELEFKVRALVEASHENAAHAVVEHALQSALMRLAESEELPF